MSKATIQRPQARRRTVAEIYANRFAFASGMASVRCIAMTLGVLWAAQPVWSADPAVSIPTAFAVQTQDAEPAPSSTALDATFPSSRRVQAADTVSSKTRQVARTLLLDRDHLSDAEVPDAEVPDAEESQGHESDANASAASGPNLPLEHLVRKVLTGVSLLSLGGIVLFVVYWKRPSAPANPSAQLRLVSSLAIAPRCTLSLIDASGQSFLVARDAAGIKKIVPVRGEFETYLSEMGDTDVERSTATPWMST